MMKEKKYLRNIWLYMMYALFVFLALAACGANSKDGMVLGILTYYSWIGVVILDHLVLGFMIGHRRLLFYEIMTTVTVLAASEGFICGWRDQYQSIFIFL